MFTSAGPTPATAAKRRFDDGATEQEVELTLKRKKQRILPIRTSISSMYHASTRQHDRHDPAPDDSPIIFHPEPSTLTPAESDEGDAEAYPRQAVVPPEIPCISAEGLLARPCEDLDMDDSSPMPTPARHELLSPWNVSHRLPTPRYGSFMLRPLAQHAGYDVAMAGVEEGIVRALGMSSLNAVTENRTLPSPINESLPRQSIDYDRDDTALDVMTPPRPDRARMEPPDKRADRGRGTGKPMLVMGYRADCEKCRARVPGHYSHIVRS